jgi:hypothetical protein
MHIHLCTYLWCLTQGVVRVSPQHNFDGLLCFSSVWPCIKNSPSSGQGLPPSSSSLAEEVRDITQYCISVLATKTCWDNWLNPVCAWTDLVCAMYIRCSSIVHTLYIHVNVLYMGNTDYLQIPLPYMPACTALVMCYAIVQELAILYRQGSDRDIPPKNDQGRW